MIGDVGGTNVRLTLRKLDLTTRTSTEIKAFKKYKSNEVDSLADAITDFTKVSFV